MCGELKKSLLACADSLHSVVLVLVALVGEAVRERDGEEEQGEGKVGDCLQLFFGSYRGSAGRESREK